MTTEIFKKYISDQCTPDERMEVRDWLQQCTPEELDEVLIRIWNDTQGDLMPEDVEKRLMKQIPGLRKQQKKIISLKWLQAAAALIAGVVVLAGYQWFNNKETRQPISAVITPQKTAAIDSLIINNTADIKPVTLPDNSAVSLYPNASIRYPVAYKTKRDLVLTGKAVFSVAKDKHHPFTVYARDLATTALGTEFLVDASDSSRIHIKLYEGKISVKCNKDQQILMPGDSLVYSDVKGSLSLKRPRKDQGVQHSLPDENPRADTLHFFQTPLQEVFTTLAGKYKTTIQFNNEDLKGMSFTGEVSTKTSLLKVIRLIAQMNGLHCQNDPKGYTISSK